MRYDAKTQRLVPYLSGISAEDVAFSRDGAWVAYVTYPEQILWRSKVDGTDRLRLTFSPRAAAMPRWSPDGTRIAFIGLTANDWTIHLIAADGGSAEEVARGNMAVDTPNWSPDGESLVFGGQKSSQSLTAPSQFGIYKFDLRTRKVSMLPGTAGLDAPQLSCDGQHLVAQPSSDMTTLVVYDLNTRKRTELTKSKVNTIFLGWSRDGKSGYVAQLGETNVVLERVRMGDRKVEQVANLTDLRLVNGAWFYWMAVAPDDSPLMLRDVGSKDIYALDWEAP